MNASRIGSVAHLTAHLSLGMCLSAYACSFAQDQPVRVRVASISFEPVKLDLAENTKRLESWFRRAANGRARIAVAPEGVLEGYVVNEILAGEFKPSDMNKVAVAIDSPTIKRFQKLAKELDMCLVFGFAERIEEDVFNSALFIDNLGVIRGKYHKMQFHEGYDSSWWFNRLGKQSRAFDTPYGRCGVMICNDRWNPLLAKIPALDGAQFFVIPSFGSTSKSQDEAVLSRGRENHLPIIEANVGVRLIVSEDRITEVDREREGVTFGEIIIPSKRVVDVEARDRVEAEFLAWRQKEMPRRLKEYTSELNTQGSPKPSETRSAKSKRLDPELPPLLRFKDGSPVEGLDAWDQRRRELKELIQHYEYGHIPPRPDDLKVVEKKLRQLPSALEERITISIGPEKKIRMRIAVYRPLDADGKRLPVLIREEHALGHIDEVPQIIDRVYMFVEFAREDLALDRPGAASTARSVYPNHDWATLAVWAWGAMRVVDYLETRSDVSQTQIGIVGHSRGGKMALFAGAMDERFALVAPNGSGCGGAGCFRISAGKVETLELITRPDRFGHWFHPRLREFAGRESELPVDQHFLKALVAPRALLCTEALDDEWANPVGNRATSRAAQPVFDMLGSSKSNGLHFREGGHDLTDRDWKAILDFADWHFRGKRPKKITKFRQF